MTSTIGNSILDFGNGKSNEAWTRIAIEGGSSILGTRIKNSKEITETGKAVLQITVEKNTNIFKNHLLPGGN